MTPERIAKLRALADRGVGGEKQNAKDILTKAGLDWKEPTNGFINNVKQTFGANINKDFVYEINHSSDPLLMLRLYDYFTGNHDGIKIGNNKLTINCTPSQNEDIKKVFFKNRKDFDNQMHIEALKYINGYLKI